MFWNKKQTPLFLVCDVGSSSVGLALVQKKNEKQNIIFANRIPVSIQDSFDQEKLESHMVLFFEEAIKNLQDTLSFSLGRWKGERIERAILVFSSPWYVSKTLTTIIEKEKPFLLDSEAIGELLQDEEKKFEKEVIFGSKPNLKGRDIHMIERELMKTKLNGYETQKPVLKHAKYAELSLYMSLVPHALVEKMKNLLHDRLHIYSFKMSTFPFVSFMAMRRILPNDSEYILVDIAGEVTDISIVREDVLVSSESFSFGRNEILRDVSTKLGLPMELAISSLSLWSEGALDSEFNTQINVLLDNKLNEWVNLFRKTLMAMDKRKPAILKIFVSVDEDMGQIFFNKLKGDMLSNPHQIFLLSNEILNRFVSYEKHVLHDPFLSFETLFLR